MTEDDDILGCKPDKAKHMLSKDTGYNVMITIERQTQRYRVTFLDQGRQIGYAVRTLEPSDQSIKHGYIRFEDNANSGAGTAFLRNSVVAYRRRHIKRIDLHADLEAGGYVWARLGFRPTPESWRRLRNDIISRIDKRPLDISENTRNRINAALADDDPEAIWDIADEREEFNRQPIGRYLLAGHSWNGWFDLTDPDCVKRLYDYAKSKRSQ